ncbi:hypothetical protein J7K93_11850 [bacterium]|nr:hypothetical protein [bacterium]
MSAVEVKPGIFLIGVNDRTTDLFEGLWPISKEGVSYNTYLINDEKKVLIDLVKAFKPFEFNGGVNQQRLQAGEAYGRAFAEYLKKKYEKNSKGDRLC